MDDVSSSTSEATESMQDLTEEVTNMSDAINLSLIRTRTLNQYKDSVITVNLNNTTNAGTTSRSVSVNPVTGTRMNLAF